MTFWNPLAQDMRGTCGEADNRAVSERDYKVFKRLYKANAKSFKEQNG